MQPRLVKRDGNRREDTKHRTVTGVTNTGTQNVLELSKRILYAQAKEMNPKEKPQNVKHQTTKIKMKKQKGF